MSIIYGDLALLALVIESGGFTRASKASGITKSRLSRRIGELEQQLGVHLIDRTSRRFAATPIGMELCRHGLAIRDEGEAALDIARESLKKPSGALRVACPVVLAELVVGAFCLEFAEAYPDVAVRVDVTDGTRTPSVDGYDILLSAAIHGLPSSDTVARRLMLTEYELVASREWVDRVGRAAHPQDVEHRDGIGWWDDGHVPTWHLHDGQGHEFELHIKPRLITNNLYLARLAALRGFGMARLPRPLCAADIAAGTLRRVLPDWQPRPVSIYAMYPSRRSLTLAGRVFVAELSDKLARWAADFRTEQQDGRRSPV